MKNRIIEGKWKYLSYILRNDRNVMLKEMGEITLEQGTNKWIKELEKDLRERGVTGEDIRNKTNEEIREKMKEWDLNEWRREMSERESLKMYREWRKEIGNQERIYDNRQSSMLLFKCRTNTLNLNDRKRFQEESTECKLCGYEKEDLRHFLLWCPSYVLPREKNEALHQPYEENEENIIGKLLFGNNIKKNKETIYECWKIREAKLKELHQNP